MNKDSLIDALGRIDDDLIRDVESLRQKRKSDRWKKWAGLAACFCLILAAVAAMPGRIPEKPPVPNDFPAHTDTPVETIHLEPALIWTVHYNEAESMVAMDRAYIQGIFSEELTDTQMAAVLPDRWADSLDCSGYGVFDNHGNLLDVFTVTITSSRFPWLSKTP